LGLPSGKRIAQPGQVKFCRREWRELFQKSLRSLRLQKVQAVNLDLSPFTDPNSNPALHQMVSQMISERVNVTVNEQNLPVTDRAAGMLAVYIALNVWRDGCGGE
jgi:hypothetical protein